MSGGLAALTACPLLARGGLSDFPIELALDGLAAGAVFAGAGSVRARCESSEPTVVPSMALSFWRALSTPCFAGSPATVTSGANVLSGCLAGKEADLGRDWSTVVSFERGIRGAGSPPSITLIPSSCPRAWHCSR